jgi:hypothetical protein
MENSRRQFLKGAAVAAVAAVPVLNELTKNIAMAEDLKEVSPEDPTAKALGYHSDATKVDTAKFPKRAGEQGAKQFCSNCILMVSKGVKIPGSEGSYGKCSVIASGLVNERGWCNSWVLNPGA